MIKFILLFGIIGASYSLFAKTDVEPNISLIPVPIEFARKEGIPEGSVIAVKYNDNISAKNLELFCLAKNIFHEAGVESNDGKLAVAQITLNRVKSNRYPNSICKVVFQPNQFSWTINNNKNWWTTPKGIRWDESLNVANKVLLKGHRHKGLNDISILHYHADYVSPVWGKPEKRVAKVGQHIFYFGVK